MKLAIVLVCLFAASCVVAPKPRMAVFEPAEFAPYEVTGTGAIEGQAFLRTRGGDVKVGAGSAVYLDPATPSYSREWFTRGVLRGERLEQADGRCRAFTKKAVADGEGRFRFENLPAGSYYLVCQITWEAFTGQYTERTGGVAYAEVSVEDGKTARAVVTSGPH